MLSVLDKQKVNMKFIFILKTCEFPDSSIGGGGSDQCSTA